MLVACRPFAPCRGRLTFFVLPKKVSKERRAQDGDFPLDFCRGEGGEANSLRSDSLPSFSSPQQKSKAPSRAEVKHTISCPCTAPSCVPNYSPLTASLALAFRIPHSAFRIPHHASRITHSASRITHHASRITQSTEPWRPPLFTVGLAFDVPALDGALNFRKRAEKGRGTV